MAIGSDPARARVNQNKPAKNANFIAAVYENAWCGGADGIAVLPSYVQTIIHPTPALWAELTDNISAQRPSKATNKIGSGCWQN
jgi:phytoene/squalene synthetase